MNRDEVRAGVLIFVPKDADKTRPGLAYVIEVAAAYDGLDPDWVRVGGHVRRADGSPSTRKHSYRDADLFLPMLNPVKEASPVG